METKNIILYIAIVIVLIVGLLMMFLLKKNFDKTLKQNDYIDKLTGLYNYEGFVYNLNKKNNELITILSFDIKRSHDLENQIGTKLFEEMLKDIKDIFLEKTETPRIVGRYDYDVFSVLIRTEDASKANDYAEEIIQAISKLKNELYNLELYCGYCVGFEREETLKKSLLAVKFAKRGNNKILEYNDDIAKYQNLYDKISHDPSIIKEEFKVYYQPKVNATTGEIEGAEALVRWCDNQGNVIMGPDQFISEFEQNGIIYKIDLFVLEEVCKFLESLNKREKDMITISLNFSRTNFINQNLVHDIKEIISKYNFNKEYLHIEITESAYVHNEEFLATTLLKINELGIKIEMDDFGSGYSAIGSLMNLKCSVVKMDRLFVENNLKIKTEQIFLENLVKTFSGIGLGVTVEGVESQYVVRQIRKMAPNVLIQGFYFFKPMPLSKFERILMDNRYVLDDVFNEKVELVEKEEKVVVESIPEVKEERLVNEDKVSDTNNVDIEKLFKETEERILLKISKGNKNFENEFDKDSIEKLFKESEERIISLINDSKENKVDNEKEELLVEKLVREAEERLLEKLSKEIPSKEVEESTEINNELIEKIVKESEERIIEKLGKDNKKEESQREVIYKEVPVYITSEINKEESDEEDSLELEELEDYDDFIDSVDEEEANTLRLIEEYKEKYREEWEKEMYNKHPELLKKHYEKRAFIEKLMSLDSEQKANFNTLKNEIMKYGEIKNRTSKFFDTFIYKNKIVCKLGVVGKSIRLFLALNPNDYPPNQFPHKDLSDVKRHEKTPYMMKISSKLSVKRGIKLITDLATMLKLEIKDDYKEKNHVVGFQLSSSRNK